MAYNLKYTSDFKTVRNEIKSYRVNIYEKDFIGSSSNILLGSDPVIQDWQDEGYKTPVRGCSLSINIINDGSISITNFYSNEDDTFQVELIDLSNDVVLFMGYIVQDDCQELQVDFAHVINISATDNLGLLKSITLDQAYNTFGNDIIITGAEVYTWLGYDHAIISTSDEVANFNAGDQFEILSGDLAGVWTVVGVFISSVAPNVYYIQVIEDTSTTVAPYFSDINTKEKLPFNGIYPIKEFLRLCLQSTNLELPVHVWSDLYPIDGTYSRWVDDVFLDVATFKNPDGFFDCYRVLEIILDRFSATLFQARGFWYIVRWGEFWRYSTLDGASYPLHIYNYDFSYIGSTNETMNFDFHNLSDIQTGLLKSINRPIKLTQEVFNYEQADILCNADLTQTGDLLETAGTFPNLTNRYESICWEDNTQVPFTPKPIHYIEVVTNNDPSSDDFGREIDRYLVVKGPLNDYQYLYESIESGIVYVNTGDVIKLSFNIKTVGTTFSGIYDFKFKIRLVMNSITKGLNFNVGDDYATWDTVSLSYVHFIFDQTFQDQNGWVNVEIQSPAVPEPGYIVIYPPMLGIPVAPPAYPIYETRFQDFKLQILNRTDSTYRAIGHQHTDQQFVNLKNNSEKEIFIDDSKFPTVKGTLFLETFNGVVRNKTNNWNYVGASLSRSLGHMTTLENLFQNYYAKDIYDGTHLEIANDNGDIMSPASVLKDAQDPELKRYVFGALSLNYREGTADFTMYEVDNSDITMAGFNGLNLYEFKYLYEQ